MEENASESTSTTRVGGKSSNDPPNLAACFVIRFDKRVGYKLDWSRSITECNLENSVEFKALPSGLHNIREDVIYFVQDEWASLSVFRSKEATEEDRNATFVSVGILVPSQDGRLGRAWLHQGTLKQLTRDFLQDDNDYSEIEKFWDQNRIQDDIDATINPVTPLLAPAERNLSKYHPILFVKDMLDVFGPLIFPLYKAALLRKRILFVAPPPLNMLCNYVFILSVISSIPSQTLDNVSDVKIRRSKPLFSIGIHDIPRLEEMSKQEDAETNNWIACTSDELLSIKDQLYDVKVVFPKGLSTSVQWPTIQLSGGAKIRATQRESRRYRHMQEVLADIPTLPTRDHTGAILDGQIDAVSGDTTPILNLGNDPSFPKSTITDDREAVEPQGWTEIAFDSFMWWASAGERSATLDSEYEQDVNLLSISDVAQQSYNQGDDFFGFSTGGGLEMSLVLYFFNLTDIIMSHMSRLRRETSTSEDTTVYVYKEDLEDMGLDTWSEGDRGFVEDFTRLYLNKDASVQGSSIECCGMKFF